MLYVILTSSQGPVDQPCIRLAVRTPDSFSSDHPQLGTQRSPVCTFCLTNQKKVVSVCLVMKQKLCQSLNSVYVNTHVAYSISKIYSFSASELDVHCHIHKSQQLISILKEVKPVHTLMFFFLKIHLKFFLRPLLRFPTWLSLSVSDIALYAFYFLSSVLDILLISFFM